MYLLVVSQTKRACQWRTTGVQTVHRTGAHGPRGPIQAPYY